MNGPYLTADWLLPVAEAMRSKDSSFDQLAEEVLELHLALRGKHKDSPAYEWLQVATIAINGFNSCSFVDQMQALADLSQRHAEVDQIMSAAEHAAQKALFDKMAKIYGIDIAITLKELPEDDTATS